MGSPGYPAHRWQSWNAAPAPPHRPLESSNSPLAKAGLTTSQGFLPKGCRPGYCSASGVAEKGFPNLSLWVWSSSPSSVAVETWTKWTVKCI